RSYGDWSSDVCSSDLEHLDPLVAESACLVVRLVELETSAIEVAGAEERVAHAVVDGRARSGIELVGIERGERHGVQPGALAGMRSEERRVGKECGAGR